MNIATICVTVLNRTIQFFMFKPTMTMIIYTKSGNEIVVRGITDFNLEKNANGAITRLNWKHASSYRRLMTIDVDQIEAIVTCN